MALRFIKTRRQWENSTRTNAISYSGRNYQDLRATSWDWWVYLDKIHGKVVFNNYYYSQSTSNHQSECRALLRKQGIEVDLTIEAPKGLQDLGSAVEHYESRIDAIQDLIERPRSRADVNMRRYEEINAAYQSIADIRGIMSTEDYK